MYEVFDFENRCARGVGHRDDMCARDARAAILAHVHTRLYVSTGILHRPTEDSE